MLAGMMALNLLKSCVLCCLNECVVMCGMNVVTCCIG